MIATEQRLASITKSRYFVNAQGELTLSGRNIYYIDLFCGAGGVSTGVVRAGARVIFCINHDPIAIASHRANHPRVKHAVEDITVFDLTDLIRRVERIRAKDPMAIICLWASLECTHFSKAKGGEHREADSRTLAEHLYRYIAALQPDYIDIENVVEFMSWGPLRIACEKMHKDRCDLKVRKIKKNKLLPEEIEFRQRLRRLAALGRNPEKEEDFQFINEVLDKVDYPKELPDFEYHMVPDSKKNGKYYQRWHQTICQDYGYEYAYKVLNSADFGALTARTRYFGQFKKPGLPFTWPEATHAKNPAAQGLFGQAMKAWKAVRPALELTDEGKSIFGRKKELSDNTLKRIYAGAVKYIGKGKEPEIVQLFDQYNRNTQKTAHDRKQSEELKPTDSYNSITNFIKKYHGNGHNTLSIEDSCSTVLTGDGLALISIVWLDKHYKSDFNHQSIEVPAGTLLTKDKFSPISAVKLEGFEGKLLQLPCFIMNQFSGGGQHSSADNPLGAITTVPKANVIQADAWLFNHNYDNKGAEIDRPAPTLLASRKHYYLLNPQYTSKGNDLNRPCFTLIARMDKAPPSMIGVEEGEGAILIYADDTEIMKKIKLFMAAHGIVDIKMRMLKVRELLRIQGFGDQYQLKGTQTDQKRFIGNSVEVTLAKCKVRSRIESLQTYFQRNQKVA